MIPGINGIEVCRRIRQCSKVPVIMITAKSDIGEKVLGLDVGANDYLTKPFAIEELLARIMVYERNKSISNKSDKIKVKDIVMDNKTHEVKRKGNIIELTKKENEIINEVVRESKLIDNTHIISSDKNDTVKIYADYKMIKQMIRIFIDNSIKFTPKQGKIDISSGVQKNKNDYYIKHLNFRFICYVGVFLL